MAVAIVGSDRSFAVDPARDSRSASFGGPAGADEAGSLRCPRCELPAPCATYAGMLIIFSYYASATEGAHDIHPKHNAKSAIEATHGG
jgi:hypothetical protein